MRVMELNFKKIVLDYLDTKMYHDMNEWEIADVKVYSETTADGYELFVVAHDDQNLNISEDVYYYDSDVADSVMANLEQGYSVYIDEYFYDDVYLGDSFEEYFGEHVDDIVDANPESFTKEELEFVKTEYGVDEEE